MENYTINLSENTIKNLRTHPELFTHAENKDLQQIIQYIVDRTFLENNRVNEVPIPKGCEVYPHH